MELFNWWKRWKKGDAVCKVASAEALNRVYNVLEGIEAIGLNGIDAQINKPTDAQGRGWTIVVDGNPLKSGIGGDHWGVFEDPADPTSSPWTTGPGEDVATDGVDVVLSGATVSQNTESGTGAVNVTITPVVRQFAVDSMGNVRIVGAPISLAPIVLHEVQKRVISDIRWDESSHTIQAKYSTLTCLGYVDDTEWTSMITTVPEMP